MSVLPFPGRVVAPSAGREEQGSRAARFLVIHLPAFRLERCGFSADELVGLLAEERSAVRLVALTPAAKARDLSRGMTATEARARVPEIVLEPLDPVGEAADRLALVAAFRALSDRAAPWGEEAVAVEIGDTAHLFGGEAGALVRARELASELGHCCRVAIADDPLAAEALAAWGPGDVVAPASSGAPLRDAAPGASAVSGSAALLASLPLRALRPSDALVDALATLGIERIGPFARLDPASVVGRFGEEGRRLHRIARGGVGTPRLVDPGETEALVEEIALGGATTTLAPILFALQGLLAGLCARLAARDRRAVRLALRLVLERGPVRIVRMRVGRPTRDPELLLRVVRARLEALKLDAPAIDLSVEVEETAPDVGQQPGLTDRAEVAEAWSDLLARLADALGDDAVFTAEPTSAWRPEAAWRPRPIGASGRAPPARRPARIDPVEVLARWEADLPLPRPTLLLPRPEPLAVRVCDGRPAAVEGFSRDEQGRATGDGWRAVLRSAGPERSSGEWWRKETAFDREYWVVEVSGALEWWFREGDRWFRHGWFD